MFAGIVASIKTRKADRDAGLSSNRSGADGTGGEDARETLVSEEHFRKVLSIERKRAERSERRFVLMLVHTGKALPAAGAEFEGIAQALSTSTRETDLAGWYSNGSVAGVICTEIGTGDLGTILSALHTKVSAALRSRLAPELVKGVSISFQVFPANLELQKELGLTGVSATPDLQPVWSNKTPDYAVARRSTLLPSQA